MQELTKGNEYRIIFRFALPMLLGNVLQQLYVFVDSIIVGQFIGKEALAAIGASFPIIFALISLIIGLVTGTTVVIAQYYGAGDISRVKRAIETMYVFLFFISLLVPLLGIVFSDDLFRLIQLPDKVMPQALMYFNIFISGSIFLFFFNGTNAVLRGLGDSKTPVYFLVVSTVLNIVFDILFVIVFDSGIEGVAFATVLAQGIGFFVAFNYLKRTREIFKISWLKLRFDKDLFRKSVRIGLPSGLQQTSVSLSFLALVTIVNLFGTDVLAAYSVGARINSLATMPAMVFGNALSIFVGQNIGAQKMYRTYKGFRAALIMTTGVAVFIGFIVLVFGKVLIRLFILDEQVIREGYNYLSIIGSFYLIFNAMFVVAGFLRGAGDTFVPMLVNILTLWVVRIPIAYILSSKIGPAGIWWSFPVSWGGAVILYYIRYLTGKWKEKVVIKQNEENERDNI